MREIYLDDYHLHSLTTPGLASKVERGLEGLEGPAQRVDSYNNPGGDGETVANVLHGGRVISLEGRIRGSDEVSYRGYRAAFHRLVGANRTTLGQYSPRILKLTDATGEQYRLSCVVRSLKNPDELPTHSRFQLQLQATDFRLYAEAETTGTINLPVSGGITFPFSFPAQFGSSSGGFATASNDGTLDSPPVIRFYGPLANPRLSNLTTGQSLAITTTLLSGDIVTVDMAKRTIIQGSSTNRMGDKTADAKFWFLVPGANQLSLSAASYDQGYATITWRDAFIGL